MRSLIVLIFVFGTLRAEYLVELKNLSRKDIYLLEKSGYFDTESYIDGTLIGIAYNLQVIKGLGYKPRVILDLDSMRTHVWSRYRYQYTSYDMMVSLFDSIAYSNPDITRLDTIGYSVQNRLLLCLKVSDNAHVQEPEPEVRILGTHHGNEWISTEIPILLAFYLVENYGIDEEVTYLVNNREIYIIPMVNPDGHEMQQRRNANNVDLNRDYGYMWDGWGSSPSPYSQPESRAIYEFSQNHNFALSLSFHSYGEIVNYIWNYSPVEPPDSLLIRELSQMYASFNGYWVTEGYNWYETHGDLNDYSYGIDSDIDWTIELGNTYIPPPSQIEPIWLENRDAILAIIREAGQGISGVVLDSITGDTIKYARINVLEIGWPVFTDPITGDFVRVLQPGTYSISVEANGYHPKVIYNIPVYDDSLTQVTVYLAPGGEAYAYKYVVVEQEDPNNAFNNQTLPPWGLGPPDGQFVSIGVSGELVIATSPDFPIVDSFTIYEGEDMSSPETYTVFASNHWDGPWSMVGTATGTHTFSLQSSGIGLPRFIRITDDGNGQPNSLTPGFDFDALKIHIFSGVAVVLIDYWAINQDSSPQITASDTVFLFGKFKNVGTYSVYSLQAYLSSFDEYSFVIDTVVEIGDLMPGDSTLFGPLRFYLSDSLPMNYSAQLQLTLTGQPNYTTSFELSIPVLTPLHYIVWDPDPNPSSGSLIHSILDSLGLQGIYTTELQPYWTQLEMTDVLFISLGIYPNNYIIYAGDPNADTIVSYLVNHGGRVYLEGGDVWYYDPIYAGGYNFNQYFGINALDDGTGNLSLLQGISGTFTSGMNFNYIGENNWIDQIEALPNAFNIWENIDPQYFCGVANVESVTTFIEYRTVGVSFEFSGLQNTDFTQTQYLTSMLNFLGLSVGSKETSKKDKYPTIHLTLPNPTTLDGIINVYSPKDGVGNILLFDISGRRIRTLKSINIKSGWNVFPLKTIFFGLPTGVYFLTLSTHWNSLRKKIVYFSVGGVK